MKIPHSRPILLSFGLASTALVMGALLLLEWKGGTAAVDSFEWVSHTLEVQRELATVEAEIQDAQGTRSTALAIFARPIARFLWCYVWKGGYRFGTRGLIWSTIRATAEWVRWAKLWERQNVSGDRSQPPRELVERTK